MRVYVPMIVKGADLSDLKGVETTQSVEVQSMRGR